MARSVRYLLNGTGSLHTVVVFRRHKKKWMARGTLRDLLLVLWILHTIAVGEKGKRGYWRGSASAAAKGALDTDG